MRYLECPFIKGNGGTPLRTCPLQKHFGSGGNIVPLFLSFFSCTFLQKITKRLKTWVWDGSSWMSVLDENITDTWNGGLVFYRSEAEAGGSTVQASTGDGSVTWTMRLDPDQ